MRIETFKYKFASRFGSVLKKAVKKGGEIPVSVLFNLSALYGSCGQTQQQLQTLLFLQSEMKAAEKKEANSSFSEYFSQLLLSQFEDDEITLAAPGSLTNNFVEFQICKLKLEINENTSKKSSTEFLAKLCSSETFEIDSISSLSLSAKDTKRYFIFSLLSTNQPQKALEESQNFLQLFPEDHTVLAYKADAEIQLNLTKQAICTFEILEKVYEKLSQNLEEENLSKFASMKASLCNNKAVVFTCEEKWDNALREMNEAVRLEMSSIEYNFNLAYLLLKMGKEMDGCCVWFNFRGTPNDRNLAFYEENLNQVREKLMLFNQTKIMSNVVSKVTEKQALQMDYLTLERWSKRIQREIRATFKI